MKRLIVLLVISFALFSLVGCDMLSVTPEQRITDFITDINAATPDYTSIQTTHFSPTMADYEELDTSVYWDGTFFNTSLSGTISLASTAAVESGDTATLTTQITGSTAGTFTAEFILVKVAVNSFMSDWLINYILVSDSGSPVPIEVLR